MLANLVHATGANPVPGTNLAPLANLVHATGANPVPGTNLAPGNFLDFSRSVTRRVTRAEQTSTVADHPKPLGSQPMGPATAFNNLHTHKIE
jgi:hypothetical protein